MGRPPILKTEAVWHAYRVRTPSGQNLSSSDLMPASFGPPGLNDTRQDVYLEPELRDPNAGLWAIREKPLANEPMSSWLARNAVRYGHRLFENFHASTRR
jgi:hypothetical protein